MQGIITAPSKAASPESGRIAPRFRAGNRDDVIPYTENHHFAVNSIYRVITNK